LQTIFRKHIFLLLFISALIAFTAPVLAQDDSEPDGDPPGVTMTAVAAFDRFYRSLNWFPVQVTLANNGPQIDGYVEIDTGSTSSEGTIYQLPVLLPTQSRQQATLIINAPSFGTELNIDLRDNDGNLIARSTELMRRLNDGDILFGVVSPDPGEFTFLESLTTGSGRNMVAYLTLEQLPETAVAWKALDFLILNDVDTAQFSNEQQTALRQWVQNGGQLIITGGSGWQKTSAGLSDLLPVDITGSTSVPDLPDLSASLGTPFRDPGPYLIAESNLRSGDLLITAGDLPVLARDNYGRGGIFFLSLDPRFAPLLDWAGNDLIWEMIIDYLPAANSFGAGPVNSYAADNAVSLLPSLALPSIFTLLIFLLVYTVIIGPVNYLILKRRKRTEQAWATIPAIVLIFSAATYVTGFQLRGNSTIINQYAVAYSTVGVEEANVHTLIGLYSPRRSVYDLQFGPGVAARPFSPSFDNRLGEDSSGRVVFTDQTSIADIRVDISEVSTFVAENNQPALALDGQAQLEIIDNNLQLVAAVQNNSDLSLETVSLLLGDTAVAIGSLAPGEAKEISQVLRSVGSSTIINPGSFATLVAPSGRSPLTSNAGTILGSTAYYDDRELYPRFELLSALEPNSMSSTGFSFGADTAVLFAWTKSSQLPVSLAEGNFSSEATTLHLVALPLQINLPSGGEFPLPLSLLDWSTLAQNNVYDPNIENLNLNLGWIEFEYQPWPDFQSMIVSELEIHLTAAPGSESFPTPNVRIYDWNKEEWVLTEITEWGEWPVENPAPYIGENNAVRLRLEDNSDSFGLLIEAVYPILTGVSQ
jgi:hypothetical protein